VAGHHFQAKGIDTFVSAIVMLASIPGGHGNSSPRLAALVLSNDEDGMTEDAV
jgi:hypothetical protein